MAGKSFLVEPGKQEIIITRRFDAQRELVFQVFIDPKLLPQWWGPKYLTTTVEKMVAKSGGSWRFIQHDQPGNVYAFHGVYHTVQPPGSVIYNFEFEGMPGHVVLETVTFEEQGSKTRMIEHIVFQSVEDRDGMVSTGMEVGTTESMDRFARLLAKVAQTKESQVV
jgi:uncharacterized protein YndB with AHSA1/START domain